MYPLDIVIQATSSELINVLLTIAVVGLIVWLIIAIIDRIRR